MLIILYTTFKNHCDHAFLKPMRKELGKSIENRKKFKAIFSRFGKKINFKGHSEETVLLKHIIDLENNQEVADHLWFNYSKSFEKAQLNPGDILEFAARVKSYKKGYVNKPLKINLRTTDFKLSHPTQIKKLKKASI